MSDSLERMVLVAPPQDAADALVVGLATIPEAGLLLEVAIRPGTLQLPQTEDAVVTEAVQVQGRLTKVVEQLFFHGRIYGTVTVPCSRCLETAHADFSVETRVIFLPPTSTDVAKAPEGRSGSADEPDLYIHDGTVLDLRPLVREQVVLAYPVQALCRDDCAGLCQVCGGNRNLMPCTCQAGGDDPRFAILKRLRPPGAS
jgi:uncharacterized protein